MKLKFDQGDVVAFDTWPLTKIPRIGVVISMMFAWTMRVTITKAGKVKMPRNYKCSIPIYILESGKKNYSAVAEGLVKLGRLSQ